MKCLPLSRGVVLLAALALGACDGTRNPVATEPAAAPRLSTHPAPSLTVTNSGGYPLISWSALAGATSYSVVLRKQRTEIDKVTFGTETQNFDSLLGSTTGTSFLDTANGYTGKFRCTSYGTYKTVWLTYTYRVTATFPDGTSTGIVSAPVAPC